MKKATIISWQQVFNSDYKLWWHVDEVVKVARLSAYPYFSWKGDIYYTATGKKTKYKIENVK